MVAAPRTEKLDLRLSAEAKQRITAAAAATHRSVSEFVLGSALAQANETLADRRRFVLDEEHWQAFDLALDAPARDISALRQFLHEPSVFEQEQESQ